MKENEERREAPSTAELEVTNEGRYPVIGGTRGRMVSGGWAMGRTVGGRPDGGPGLMN